jgi:hypothetical protein
LNYQSQSSSGLFREHVKNSFSAKFPCAEKVQTQRASTKMLLPQLIMEKAAHNILKKLSPGVNPTNLCFFFIFRFLLFSCVVVT